MLPTPQWPSAPTGPSLVCTSGQLNLSGCADVHTAMAFSIPLLPCGSLWEPAMHAVWEDSVHGPTVCASRTGYTGDVATYMPCLILFPVDQGSFSPELVFWGRGQSEPQTLSSPDLCSKSPSSPWPLLPLYTSALNFATGNKMSSLIPHLMGCPCCRLHRRTPCPC